MGNLPHYNVQVLKTGPSKRANTTEIKDDYVLLAGICSGKKNLLECPNCKKKNFIPFFPFLIINMLVAQNVIFC